MMNPLRFLDQDKLIPYTQLKFMKQLAPKTGAALLYIHNTKRKQLVLKFYNSLNEQNFRAEFISLSLLSHDNIIKYYGYTEFKFRKAYIMEFMDGGGLDKIIHCKSVTYSLLNITWWHIQIAQALEFLHSRLHIFCNLKPPSVLLDAQRSKIKICGFDYCREMSLTEANIVAIVNPFDVYMAPEVVSNMPVNDKCDAYSLALVLWESCSRDAPWNQSPQRYNEWKEYKLNRDHRLKPIENVPVKVNEIISKCFNYFVEERYSVPIIKGELESLMRGINDAVQNQ